MNPSDFHALHPKVSQLITEVSRDLLLPAFSKGIDESSVRYKKDKSIVTEIDFQAQDIFERGLKAILPNSCVLGEENSDHKPDATVFASHEYAWIVDAVDGTHRFVDQQPDFTTLVCLCYKGRPHYGWLYLPTEDRLFAGGQDVGVFDNQRLLPKEYPVKAQKEWIGSLSPNAFYPFERQILANCRVFAGLRNHLCAGYKFAGLLTDALDFAAFGRAAPWDLAAGFVLLQAMGGYAATWEDKPLDMQLLWHERREWYLATRCKKDWNTINTMLFNKVTIDS
jgi:fructose-1,6-bisphosphatase/inositol monophosphatase family enzyme